MGFSQEIISLNKDIKSFTIINTNSTDFQTDVFRYLVKQEFFQFTKIAEIKETVEKLKFKNNQIYSIYGIEFTVKRVLLP